MCFSRLILASFALAVCGTTYAGTTVSNKTVSTVHTNLGGGIYFKTSETMVNPDGCTASSWYHIATGATYEKEAFSLLLAARMAGAPVTFYLDGCAGTYPKVSWVNTHD